MIRRVLCATLLFTAAALGCSSDDSNPDQSTAPLTADDGLSFFVTSQTSMTGNLGGLSGADEICGKLATAVGAGAKTWRAYLSTDTENARDRIGKGPWFNANRVKLADDIDALHSIPSGNADLFIDEHGNKIPGQWAPPPTDGSMALIQHDIMTGSTAQGTVQPNDDMGRNATCSNWTSAGTDAFAWVGHSDGMGPMMSTMAPYNSWNSSHANQDCSNTAPRGGSGRIYCFATSR